MVYTAPAAPSSRCCGLSAKTINAETINIPTLKTVPRILLFISILLSCHSTGSVKGIIGQAYRFIDSVALTFLPTNGEIMEKVEKQVEKKHGRYRPGAGRKPKYGTKTVVMRIPENRVQEVQNLVRHEAC
jgi:hypothetical protein